MTTLSVAISPCPNDTFIFGAWILGHAPAPAGLDSRFLWHDVQELNQGALDNAWDVIKVSAATALRLTDTHSILSCGGAFGLEHGLRPHTAESVGTFERERRLERHERARAPVGIHGDAEELPGEERVHVDGAISQDRDAIDGRQLLVVFDPDIERGGTGAQPMDAVLERLGRVHRAV